MKKINVIDLDKTLIPFDSYLYFILALLKTKRFFKVALYILKRFIGLIDNTGLKEKLILEFRRSKKSNYILKTLINQILKNLDKKIISQVAHFSDDDTINILCSASPSDYVKLIGEQLKWQTIASDFYDTGFINMRGYHKILCINKQYPQSKYIYNFAISDSKEDLALLKLFKHYELKKQKNKWISHL